LAQRVKQDALLKELEITHRERRHNKSLKPTKSGTVSVVVNAVTQWYIEVLESLLAVELYRYALYCGKAMGSGQVWLPCGVNCAGLVPRLASNADKKRIGWVRPRSRVAQ
jgi:hypothetical protein